MVRGRMADTAIPQKRTIENWIWAMVIAAAGSVIAVAVLHRNEGAPRRAKKPPISVSLPLLGGGGKAAIRAGKVTVVDFWATWCAPCRASMPRVQKVWQEYSRSGVDLYSVDTDDPAPDRDAQVRDFLKENQLTFPVVLDDGSAASAFSVASLPTMVLVDKSGEVAWMHVGALTSAREKELRSAIDRALSP